MQNQTTLRCVSNPSTDELWTLWETMQADQAALKWYPDTFPETFADFMAKLISGSERCIIFFDGAQMAGSYWLHDMVDDDPEHPPCAWVRAYVPPAYRGRFLAPTWPVARSVFEQWGYWNLFSATHAENKPGLGCLIKSMKFTLVDTYPGVSIFGGKPAACTVFTMRPEDAGFARRMAELRASRLVAA